MTGHTIGTGRIGADTAMAARILDGATSTQRVIDKPKKGGRGLASGKWRVPHER
jgi:hypothetical protein